MTGERGAAIVVGGGVGGLTIARDLARGGMDVTLFEASDHFGGKVARHTVAGLDLDAGAESFATRRDTVAEYAIELAIGRRVVQPNPAGAWLQTKDGPAIALPKTGLLGIPGTPLAADVISVIGTGAALRAELDVLQSGLIGSKEKYLGPLVRRRMGKAVLDKLVTPVAMGIHSKHPDELEVDVVAPGLRTALLDTGSLSHAVLKLRDAAPAGTAVSGLDGGMFELVQALLADLFRWGADVVADSAVSAVTAHSVTLADGAVIEADHVVLATSLSAKAADSIVLATLVLDLPDLDVAPRGTGVLVAPGATGIRAKALTHATAKWPWLAALAGEHRHVLRLSYNGPPQEGFEELVRTDASALLGVQVPAESVVGFASVGWPPPASAPSPIDGVTLVGEGIAGTGLAAVIRQARGEAERLLTVDRG
jgi:oxygen-dependent protoporphyrinogen oxidase